MYLNLSWRNIWRNKKRTIIAVASVFFAVIIAVNTRSMQLGSYSYMIHSSARFYTGYFQIQQKNYWEKRSLENTLLQDSIDYKKLRNANYVKALAPRLESFALISFKNTTRVAQVVGIDPQMENEESGLKERLVKGEYLEPQDYSGLISKGLAQLLGVSIGDSIVLYGQGYHGQIAAALLPVKGIIEYPIRELNNTMFYLPLKAAQDIFLTGNRLTSVAVMIDDNRHLEKAKQALSAVIPPQYTLLDWKTMLPELHQSIQFDNISGMLMLAILYVVIAFGVFGTIIMMINERVKEFGILIAVGMKKVRLLIVTFWEIVFIAFLGAASGLIAAIPIVWYFSLHPIRFTGDVTKTFDALGIEPIFSFSTDPLIFLNQALVVFLIALATFIYPIYFMKRFEASRAIRS
ncbi:MAG: ABC transporter permease [Calditrichaeota bacterium]|nr:ABC transporter permease [Calditrichota bacterium]